MEQYDETQARVKAQDFVAAGISVIPLRLDGSKAPAIRSWKAFQSRLPSAKEQVRWSQRPHGVGAVCGVVSSGLEVLDFDHDAAVGSPRKQQIKKLLDKARDRGHDLTTAGSLDESQSSVGPDGEDEQLDRGDSSEGRDSGDKEVDRG